MSSWVSVSALVIDVAVNTLWLGTVIAVVVAAFLGRGPRASHSTRHALWGLALVATMALAFGLATRHAAGWRSSVAMDVSSSLGGEAIDEPTDTDIAGHVRPSGRRQALSRPTTAARASALGSRLEVILPSRGWVVWLVALLGAVTGTRLLRLGWAVVQVKRLAASGTPIAGARLRHLPRWSAASARGRRTRLCWSARVANPMLVGLGPATILLPRELEEDLTDDELDHVALHELAHARRLDDWTRLAQRLAVALLWFHPAAHWMARRMDAECESACDEWVVSQTGDPRPYASCLVRLGELLWAGQTSPLAPGATTHLTQLSRRVEALVKLKSPAFPRIPLPSLATLVVTLLFVVVAGSALSPTLVAAPPSPPISSSSIAPPPVMGQRDAADSPPAGAATPRARALAAIARDDVAGEDARVRSLALESLGERAGAVVVMDPRNGRVLAIVNQDWAARQAVPPASTIKLVTAIVALGRDDFDPEERLRVALPRPRSVDLTDALAFSSSDYFQALGERYGPAPFLECARALGLGAKTGVNVVGESSGRVPEPGEPDTRFLYGNGVGFEVTPMQLAVLVSAIANGGDVLQPVRSREPVRPSVRRNVPLVAGARERLLEGMRAAVTYGTAARARVPGVDVAGKTGSWEVDDQTSIGLFVSFAPATEPRAVVVALTRGEDERGSSTAGVAARVYAGLLDVLNLADRRSR